jgi:hypothetical protein
MEKGAGAAVGKAKKASVGRAGVPSEDARQERAHHVDDTANQHIGKKEGSVAAAAVSSASPCSGRPKRDADARESGSGHQDHSQLAMRSGPLASAPASMVDSTSGASCREGSTKVSQATVSQSGRGMPANIVGQEKRAEPVSGSPNVQVSGSGVASGGVKRKNEDASSTGGGVGPGGGQRKKVEPASQGQNKIVEAVPNPQKEAWPAKSPAPEPAKDKPTSSKPSAPIGEATPKLFSCSISNRIFRAVPKVLKTQVRSELRSASSLRRRF